MSNAELTNALEEGRLLLAQRFLRSKQYEEAIDALQVLKCPEATFQQGQVRTFSLTFLIFLLIYLKIKCNLFEIDL